MEEIIALSANHYSNSDESNYGDCFIINTGDSLFIYDCGSEEHSNEVINYMYDHGFETAEFILSHNDSDHFKGLINLVEKGKVSKIYTTLLLKHTDDILNKIGDDRRTRDSVKAAILEEYDNIAKLSGYNLCDIYTTSKTLHSNIHNEVSIVGPSYNYMISTVAKNLDSREGNIVDEETAKNATSVQLSIAFGSHKILLCGDSSFEAIESNLENHNVIQLPHHGKPNQANSIFDAKWKELDTIYIVSDNTGNSNGGSDDLNTSGRKVYNTKSGNVVIDQSFFERNRRSHARTGSLCL